MALGITSIHAIPYNSAFYYVSNANISQQPFIMSRATVTLSKFVGTISLGLMTVSAPKWFQALWLWVFENPGINISYLLLLSRTPSAFSFFELL